MLCALCSTGCLPSIGECDQEAALEVVYKEDGTPAFAGQAILETSCGAGGFCHASDDVPPQDRYGAPVDLGFDVTIASTSAAPNEEQSERLRVHTLRVLSMRSSILGQVQDGHMPPGGDTGERYRCQIFPSECGGDGIDLVYDRVADDGITFSRLPTLLDEDEASRDEAEEIMRNWLACRSPVVERTEERRDRLEDVIGFTVAACTRSCTDVSWQAIYDEILVPSCSTSACHDEVLPAGQLDFVTGGLDGAFERLVTDAQRAQGTSCRSGASGPMAPEPGEGAALIVPGEPDESLILLKVEASDSPEVCGSPMPQLGSPLNPQRLCALREWIACGACDMDDRSCDDCLEAARTTCRIDLSAENNCSETDPCVNRVTL